jgi:hypothetical protein
MNAFRTAYPDAKPADIIEWARSLKVNGGKTSFNPDFTPQIVEPIRAMADMDTRIGTLIKPVQVGGSTAGEVVAAYWAAFDSGLFQFNWQDDQAAEKRWHDRIKPVLDSCHDIKRSESRFEELICIARYPNITMRVQGVFMESALDSDTVGRQINEEVHLWKPGFLDKARRRQTRVWNAKALDISNAGNAKGQLHSAYEDGTQQQWEIHCPKCGYYHEMHFRYNPSKPELGGLRWDSSDCRMEGGRFNYNRLEKTIRYEFPCGYVVRDYAAERRTLKGRYSSPRNEGAHISHRSWNFEAVACDAIKWLTLIQEWHGAIRAMKVGDSEPMRRFVTERECRFWSDEMMPFSGQVIVNTAVKKDREGLKSRAARLAAADWQQGFKHLGQLTHYWLVIEDVLEDCNSQIVFEGMVATDAELIATLDEFNVPHSACVVDASKNTKAILSFCYREGLNAVSGIQSHKGSFRHADGTKRFYSEEKPIHAELNMPPRFDYVATRDGMIPASAEPVIISYNKAGLLANHFFIRDLKVNVMRNKPDAAAKDYFERVIPGDVSEDFKQQNESWERVSNKQQKTGDDVEGFRKVRKEDHLFMCLAYVDLLKEWSGLLGDQLARMGIKTNHNENEK